jgi:hypothetical protein
MKYGPFAPGFNFTEPIFGTLKPFVRGAVVVVGRLKSLVVQRKNLLHYWSVSSALRGHAPANHSNRRTDKKAYAAWEIHPVRALRAVQ